MLSSIRCSEIEQRSLRNNNEINTHGKLMVTLRNPMYQGVCYVVHKCSVLEVLNVALAVIKSSGMCGKFGIRLKFLISLIHRL